MACVDDFRGIFARVVDNYVSNITANNPDDAGNHENAMLLRDLATDKFSNVLSRLPERANAPGDDADIVEGDSSNPRTRPDARPLQELQAQVAEAHARADSKRRRLATRREAPNRAWLDAVEQGLKEIESYDAATAAEGSGDAQVHTHRKQAEQTAQTRGYHEQIWAEIASTKESLEDLEAKRRNLASVESQQQRPISGVERLLADGLRDDKETHEDLELVRGIEAAEIAKERMKRHLLADVHVA